MSPDVGILGGGLMGLTLADLLLRRGRRVTVYEAAAEPGGLLRSTRLGGVAVDRFYHCVLPTDGALLGLLSDLDLESEVAWRRVRTGFLYRGRIHSMDGILDFLRFPPLTPLQRLRLGWTIFRTSKIRRWQDVDAVPVRDYLVGLGGEAVFDTVWRPLLRCKLGPAWREASAAFIWSSISRLYAARATPDRAEKMGFLRGSYEVMLVRLLERIRAAGGEVRAPARVARLAPEAGRLGVVTDRGRTLHDQVVSTIPPGRLAPLVEAQAPDYAAELRGHRFHGVRVLLLLLRRPLTGYYVLNLADPDMPVTGVIEMGSLAPEDYFGPGRSLVYLPRYAPAGAPEYEQDEATFRRDCLQLLRRIQPAFSEDWIDAEAAFRAPEVFALPEVAYGRRVPPVRTPVPGLFFAHNLQIYPRTLHNDAVVEVARQVDVELATPRPAGP